MATIRKEKQDKNKNIIGSVVKGVTEAVVIAGVAAVATMALKDGKTRKKVKNALLNVKDQAIDYAETLKTESNINKAARMIKKIPTQAKIEEVNKYSRFNTTKTR